MSNTKNIALVERFVSVQGEGYHAGRPAVFLRFSGCNLSCVFADGAVCDTPYQSAGLRDDVRSLRGWLRTKFVEGGGSDKAHVRRQRGRHPHERPMLILTGGEPTLAPAFDDVVTLGRRLHYYVAVETNGTRWRDGLAHCHWITVSPKQDADQGSTAAWHNHNPGSPALSERVVAYLDAHAHNRNEYRYVVVPDTQPPPYLPAFRHYVSPATLSGGGEPGSVAPFTGFVPGAVERCLTLIDDDPRWHLSLQQHKLLGLP